MVDDLESREARSSNELWSEICPGLASQQPQGQEAEEFTDSFQPPLEDTGLGSGQYNVPLNPPLNPWAPMADSDVYIASLENRLRRIKGQSQEVTSREMLRTLSQAKKECWDRFLHDSPASDPFQDGSDFDQSALEHLKRWLQPEKVAVSAEELEYLLVPKRGQQTMSEGSQPGADPAAQDGEEESQTPEK
ncbi:coiled-coil domain-containing protein 32 [Paramormyrops kingsleyae]|uniref:Prolactin releasing hormone 2 receptor n=1 Tax=Paramormyrops kingsleyae TaxID=1676925 RepID=A0A3B3QMR1_9TELE|nr:coiled-coil domain-containing protein 32 [Paramormyrops kingsleyae]